MMKVLFLCVHNSARSQMAEAFLNRLGEGEFFAESAGLEPGRLNPMVVKAMGEIGYDISGKETHDVFRYFREGRKYDMVIKVCDQANGQRCPIFPSVTTILNWSFPDPAEFGGTEEEKLEQVRSLRDKIMLRIEEFIHVFAGQER